MSTALEQYQRERDMNLEDAELIVAAVNACDAIDDWGCLSIIQGRDYGHGGETARAALAPFRKEE